MRTRAKFGLGLAAVLMALAGGPHALPGDGTAAVLKTGQTQCWDEAGKVIPCAGTGQDGEYQHGIAADGRFVDNKDGTVTDRLTGLIWLKEVSCFPRMPWGEGLKTANELKHGGGCGLADGSKAGDWRMPNIKELQSLVDFGEFSPAFPAEHPFTGLKAGHYWSSTTMIGNPNRAFSLYLSFGIEGRNLKSVENFLVWPVRNAAPKAP